MIKRTLVILLAAFSVNAFAAQDIEVCWIAPTEDIKNEPLTTLGGFRLYWRETGQEYLKTERSVGIPYPIQTCTTLTDIPDESFIVATAYDASGPHSAFSNEIEILKPIAVPMAPVLLGVTRTAYTVVKQPNRFVLLSIGTVPPGTPCDINNTVNGRGAVPTDAVVWTSATGPRPVVVVAQCFG